MMPDLDIQYVRVCATNTFWAHRVMGSQGNPYFVTWGILPGHPTPTWRCQCKGFQYRGKCRHIDLAKHARCAWNAEHDITARAKGDKCPKCGGPTEVVGIGV